ncbi:unknown similar to AMEV018 [Choristoneura rosaceana entomopoxvirus 'L']|uniref:N1R/p28-like protein n=1 Tax=Choristoneura rosaceana entomopoxvirus 'L' TaxID=1293539 RepID=A0ABM9QK60_9POXV|nr:unknown similar to AMEV018 [Choristoneura rosaceana entomopoxvirus 'L']CCU55929.1 unknown similar to AMEV018 [Choristoneura rosaceana entomopoxvirus 'L']
MEFNNKLDIFDKQFDELLAKNPDWNFGKSGTAKIISIDNTVLFSVSLFLKNGTSDDIPGPQPFDYIFSNNKNKLIDFNYKTVEILTFQSDNKLPDPKWRIQVKYTYNNL